MSLEWLVNLEDAIAVVLRTSAQVDGHDIGHNEANIFVWTDDPIATFAPLFTLFETDGQIAYAKAAWRARDGDEYTVLWPANSMEPFVVT